MRIINIRNGIIGAIIGVTIIILFNQNLQTIIGQGETEVQIILSLLWVIVCFILAGIVPISLTIEDSK